MNALFYNTYYYTFWSELHEGYRILKWYALAIISSKWDQMVSYLSTSKKNYFKEDREIELTMHMMPELFLLGILINGAHGYN